MARKQNTDAPVAAETDTATTAESTATPATTETTVETTQTITAPEVTPEPEKAPVVPARAAKVPADPHERFKSITPEGITMYNFR